MFETLLTYPAALERHLHAPLYDERVSFLKKLRADGRGFGQLRTASSLLLQIIRILRLYEMRDVRIEELRSAAYVWQTYIGPARLGTPGKSAAKLFLQVGKDWFRFHGRLLLPSPKPVPYERHVLKYREYLSVQVGLAPRTVDTHDRRLKHFLQWFGRRGKHLRRLALVDIEEYLSHCTKLNWKQITIAATALVLKSFLRFSERRRWTPQKISWGIVGPRFTRFHTPHKGPSWPAVCALLRSMRGASRFEKRTRAMCLLLAKLGLRSSEVISLRLSDVDFEERVLTI